MSLRQIKPKIQRELDRGGAGIETFYAQRKMPFDDSAWLFAGMFKRRQEPAPEDQGAGFAHAVHGEDRDCIEWS